MWKSKDVLYLRWSEHDLRAYFEILQNRLLNIYVHHTWKKHFNFRNQKVFWKLLINFEKVFKILTGRKFKIVCLFSVFLSKGLTQATLALSGKILCLKLLLIAIESGVRKGSAAILVKAGGILSSLIAFLGFSC